MENVRLFREKITPRLVSLPDAAQALGVSERFLRILERRGKVRLTRIGRRVMMPVAEVDRLAAEGAE